MKPPFHIRAAALAIALGGIGCGSGLSAQTAAAPPSAAVAEPAPVTFLVPAYFYPGGPKNEWIRLIKAARKGAKVVAILNPKSGAGDAANADYAATIADFRKAGGKIIGYVPTAYVGRMVQSESSCKPAQGKAYQVADIVACAAQYEKFYGRIDGIFLDEMGPADTGVETAEMLRFYQDIYDGLKAINPAWLIVGNPGTHADEALLRVGNKGGADILVNFESPGSQYQEYRPAAYVPRHAASRFAHMLLETGPVADFSAVIKIIRSRHAAYIFVTDDTLPNPYDRLPTDWEAQVAAALKEKG